MGKQAVSSCQPLPFYHEIVPKEVIRAATGSDPEKKMRQISRKAALKAVERLMGLLDDPDTSHGDIIKTATLIFDRIYSGGAQGGVSGDFDIVVKEE